MVHAKPLDLAPLEHEGGTAEAETIAFYDRESRNYANATLRLDLSQEYLPFLEKLPQGARILDAGCGAGRDTKAFLDLGFEVDAFDASEELAAISSRLTGQKTAVAEFETWRGRERSYDGIWAFASLLHVRHSNLPDVIVRLIDALKPGGWIFANFKYGRGQRIDEKGRSYTDLTLADARRLFEAEPRLTNVRIWRAAGRAAYENSASWVNVLAQRREDNVVR